MSTTEHTIEWQTTCTDLKQRGGWLLKTEEWTDCKLLLGPEETPFHAHKLILAMASPVFESMFYTKDAEHQDTFSLPDLKAKEFEALLNYIYTDNISIDSYTSAHNLYVAANKFLIQQLARVCAEFMACNASKETACYMLQAGNSFNDQMLINESIQLIKPHIKEILHHKSFEASNINTVATIFGIPDLRVEEKELYDALDRYVKAHMTRKRVIENETGDEIILKCRQSARKALMNIRFLTFSLKDFVAGPARSGFFTNEEALAVMVNLVGGSADMPPGFSTSKIARYQRPATPIMPPPTPPSNRGALHVSLSPASPRAALSSVTSPAAAVGGRRWRLLALPFLDTNTSTGQVPERCLYIAVFVRCEDAPAGWSCQARVEFSLLATGCGASGQPNRSKTRTLDKVFTREQNEWGIQSFVMYYEIMDKSNGFVNNGALTFRANLKIVKAPVVGTSHTSAKS